MYLRTTTGYALQRGGGNACLRYGTITQPPHQQSRWSSHAESYNAGCDVEMRHKVTISATKYQEAFLRYISKEALDIPQKGHL